MDNFERFTETQLPPKDSFYNILEQDGTTDEQYLPSRHTTSYDVVSTLKRRRVSTECMHNRSLTSSTVQIVVIIMTCI